MTLRDKILKADDIKTELVPVPEWDVTIEMRAPSVLTRGEMLGEYMVDGKVDYVRMYPVLVVSMAFDPKTGEQIFTLDDVEALAAKSSAVMEKLATIAMVLAGMKDGAEQIAAGKDDSTTPPDLVFQFELARQLCCTVAELDGRISIEEFDQWMAFFAWKADQRKKPE